MSIYKNDVGFPHFMRFQPVAEASAPVVEQTTPTVIFSIPLNTVVNVSRVDLKPFAFEVETQEKSHYLVRGPARCA